MRLACSLIAAFLATASAPAAPERWAAEIDRLTADDPVQLPAPGAVVFVGSSSIRLWSTLAEDFSGLRTLNRGFGGSELADTVHYADRIILRYRPRAVVVYAGENDLWNGRTPEALREDFRALRTQVHAALPETRLLFLAIKYSPSRERIHGQVRTANRLIAAECTLDPRCRFVDVATPLFGPDGRSREVYFVEDRLHLSAAGYAVWVRVLAPHLEEPVPRP